MHFAEISQEFQNCAARISFAICKVPFLLSSMASGTYGYLLACQQALSACCGQNDVADRVFHLIVAVKVLGMETSETFLDPGVGSGDIWIHAQVIAEEQGVALIGPARLTDMEIGALKNSLLHSSRAYVCPGGR